MGTPPRTGTAFQQWLRVARALRRLTVAEAAASLGVCAASWALWERGQVPHLEQLDRLARWDGSTTLLALLRMTRRPARVPRRPTQRPQEVGARR